MANDNYLGATEGEWYHFDFELGLAGNMLPVVCDPNPTPAPGSKIKKWGKVPSAYNAQGEAHGIKDWQTRDLLPNELALWRSDPRLGICIRTGSKSGVYAIDIDIEDGALSNTIDGMLPTMDIRFRAGSPKFLAPLRIAGSPPLDKRIINTEHGRIEFLADGQQFIAAGTHRDGMRYVWSGIGDHGPDEIVEVTLAEFERMWAELSTLGIPEKVREKSTGAVDEALLTGPLDDETGARLVEALMHPKMLEAGADNDFWSEVGYALLSLGQKGWELFHDYSRRAPKYDAADTRQWWDAHIEQTPRTDYRHIFTLARRFGWGATAATAAFPVNQRSDSEADPLDIEQAPPPRPVIRLVKGNYPEITRQIADVIAPQVYKQSSLLVRIGRPDNVGDSVKRASEARSIIPLTPSYLRVLAGDAASFIRFDGRAKEWLPDDCPAELAVGVCSLGDWPNIRTLTAIARAPFVRMDGSLCDTEGYDIDTGVFYLPNDTFPKLPEQITLEMARDALCTLLTPFREFPYAVSASESVFAAHVLTEAARAAIRTAPMFWYSAPDAGTGKTLLSEMPSTIVHGTQPAVRPWVAGSEELRKTLFASLMAGDRSIMFDNVPSGHKARAPELCAFLTSPIWGDRKLGESEVIKIPNRSVLSATGNNVTPVSDMARRSLVVRLDANSTSRKLRRFQITNLRGYVAAHRVELLMAALTIIVGYQQNKSGAERVPLPAFEDWSTMVREPLIWLGLPDPVDTQAEETDDESGSINDAFAALGLHFAGREFTATSIRDLCFGFSDTDGGVAQMLLGAGCTDPTNPQRIGYWLRDCRDKIGGGYKLVRSKSDGHHATSWKLKPLSNNGDLI